MRALLILVWLAALSLVWGTCLSGSVALALSCSAPPLAIAAQVLVETALFACTIAAVVGLLRRPEPGEVSSAPGDRLAVAAVIGQIAIFAGQTPVRNALVLALLVGALVNRKDHAHA